MMKLGVKTIVYSTNDSVVKMRLSDYTPDRISLGRQFIENDCVTVHRDRIEDRQVYFDDDKSEWLTVSSASSACSDSDSVCSDEIVHNFKYLPLSKKPKKSWRHRCIHKRVGYCYRCYRG